MSNQILVKCTRSRRDFGDTASMSVAATIDLIVKPMPHAVVKGLFVAIRTAIQQYVSLRATRT